MDNPSLHTTFLCLLLLTLLFNNGCCDTDFCDTDPRIRTIENKCPGGKHAVRLLHRMSGNPNHVLHDLLWAVSHYLQNCARGEVTVISINPPMDPKQCLNRSRVNPRTTPEWGICVAVAMIEHLGSNHSFKYQLEEDLLNQTTKNCYRTETFVGVKPEENGYVGKHKGSNFCFVNFFGRNTTGKKRATYNESSLIPLPEELKVKAFQFIKDAVYKKYKVSYGRRGRFWNEKAGNSKIRVLVYDRNDTNRRQWVNPSIVTQVLDMIEDVNYTFVRSIPRSFITQVELFSWPDIIIAPHGAAMVNTIFMKEGSDIIEIWKYCLHDISSNRKRPQGWTGWHAYRLGLNLTYVQCHIANLPFKEPKEMGPGRGPDTDGLHKVRGEEILSVFQEALNRQRDIIRNKVKKKLSRHRFASILKMNGLNMEDGRQILISHLYSNERLVYVIAACFSLVMMRLLFRIRNGEIKSRGK